MAKSRVSQGKRAPKGRAEKPVSEAIRRAAERAGITAKSAEKAFSDEEIRQATRQAGYSASQADTAVRMAAAAALESPETMAEWSAKRAAFNNQPLTVTLAEACDLVAHDLKPSDFQEQVFEVIAREVDTLSDLAEHKSGESGFDGWCAFQTLCHRIRLAGKIAAVIGGGS